MDSDGYNGGADPLYSSASESEAESEDEEHSSDEGDEEDSEGGESEDGIRARRPRDRRSAQTKHRSKEVNHRYAVPTCETPRMLNQYRCLQRVCL